MPDQVAPASDGTGVTKAGDEIGDDGDGCTLDVVVGAAVAVGVGGTTTTLGSGPDDGLPGAGLTISQPPAARMQQTRNAARLIRVIVHLSQRLDEVCRP